MRPVRIVEASCKADSILRPGVDDALTDCHSPSTQFSNSFGERLPANLLQARRNYVEAYTYESVDRPRGEFLHTNWTGTGDRVASGTCTVQRTSAYSRSVTCKFPTG